MNRYNKPIKISCKKCGNSYNPQAPPDSSFISFFTKSSLNRMKADGLNHNLEQDYDYDNCVQKNVLCWCTGDESTYGGLYNNVYYI